MRIDPKNTVVTPVAAKTVRDAVAPRSSEREESATVVELSTAGAAMVEAPPAETSAAKVARISQQISRGEYKVDLEMLAARICEDEVLRGGNHD